MTAGRIPFRLRKLVLARDAGRCAFCRCAESLMGVTFEIDHVAPRSTGGTTSIDNLCLCCPTCNRHKAARRHALDPITGESVPLFHPIHDAWEEHFEWREGATLIAGCTAPGRTTVAALQMNRPVMVELRRYWAATGLHPPSEGTG
ncbi:HNH endonuclease [Sorangium sp. So ce887]|uniref:HNH endonuclease n=1 Tax=Sorangium sp. So ce887 TaxID=3133324 RepID=UPI003F6485BD